MPEWIQETITAKIALRKQLRSARKAPVEAIDWDKPITLDHGLRIIEGHLQARGPHQTYKLCLRLLDEQLSVEAIEALLQEHWPRADWQSRLDHALKYRQNDQGCEPAPLPNSEVFRIPPQSDAAEAQEEIDISGANDFGEPADILDETIPPIPTLTRDMLPKVIADYAFDVAERRRSSDGRLSDARRLRRGDPR